MSVAAESAAESVTNVPQRPFKRDRKKPFNRRQGSFGSPPSSEHPTEVFPHVDSLSEGFRRRLRRRCQTPPSLVSIMNTCRGRRGALETPCSFGRPRPQLSAVTLLRASSRWRGNVYICCDRAAVNAAGSVLKAVCIPRLQPSVVFTINAMCITDRGSIYLFGGNKTFQI